MKWVKFMNKNMIIAILAIIIIVICGAFVLGQLNFKTNTQITIINNETFQNGEQVHFELKDAKGNAISGKSVEININNQKYSVSTDQNGKGYLTLVGLSSGKYDMEVKFAGDDKYNGCNAKATITFDADSDADHPASQTNSVSTTSTGKANNGTDSPAGLTYIANLGVYVNSQGIIVATNGEDVGIGMTVDQYIEFLKKVNNKTANSGNSSNR